MAVQATASPKARTAAFTRAGLLIVAVLILDQLTKHTIAAGIGAGQERHFVPGVQLVHVRNKGVAFGFFSGGGPLVLAFTLAALAALLSYFARRPDRRWLWVPTGLLIGGALGNLIDRVANGAVTDFIKLPLWPAFNVADMAITFGVLSLLWVLEGPGGDGR
jgi:signal peptidase II